VRLTGGSGTVGGPAAKWSTSTLEGSRGREGVAVALASYKTGRRVKHDVGTWRRRLLAPSSSGGRWSNADSSSMQS
jgi:hypothetical protein